VTETLHQVRIDCIAAGAGDRRGFDGGVLMDEQSSGSRIEREHERTNDRDRERANDRLREVARVFLRLGVTAFGGPAAHLAMMEAECVQRRGWVSRAEYADMLSAANVMPGPNSTEVAMHLGLRRAGWMGLCVAGVLFILPATLMVWMLAWSYQALGARAGSADVVRAILSGMQPIVLAIVIQAVWRLGTSVASARASLVLSIVAFGALVAHVSPLVVLLAAAIAGSLLRAGRSRTFGIAATAPTLTESIPPLGNTPLFSTPFGSTLVRALPAGAGAALLASPTTLTIFATFVKLGCIVFGSGYVLLAFMRTEFVERTGWLTESQLLDAIAMGQITPGPVFASATFVGFLLGGHLGALAATLGIFLPAFAFAASGAIVLARIRRAPLASAALDGVNAASLALLAYAAYSIALGMRTSVAGALMTVVALVLVLAGRVNTVLLLLGGALAGALLGSGGVFQ